MLNESINNIINSEKIDIPNNVILARDIIDNIYIPTEKELKENKDSIDNYTTIGIEVGNMVIVGHNYNNSYMLSKLPNINIGDEIKITDNSGNTLSYIVYETQIIDPYNNDCTSQLTDGKIEVTIITCTANGENRFYTKAKVE